MIISVMFLDMEKHARRVLSSTSIDRKINGLPFKIAKIYSKAVFSSNITKSFELETAVFVGTESFALSLPHFCNEAATS